MSFNAPGIFPSDLFRLDVGSADYLGPFLGLADDTLPVFRRGKWGRRAANGGELSFNVGIGQTGVDCLIELFNNVSRCGFGRADATPGRGIIARHSLADGRNSR